MIVSVHGCDGTRSAATKNSIYTQYTMNNIALGIACIARATVACAPHNLNVYLVLSVHPYTDYQTQGWDGEGGVQAINTGQCSLSSAGRGRWFKSAPHSPQQFAICSPPTIHTLCIIDIILFASNAFSPFNLCVLFNTEL